MVSEREQESCRALVCRLQHLLDAVYCLLSAILLDMRVWDHASPKLTLSGPVLHAELCRLC